jgi:hypothetical protein
VGEAPAEERDGYGYSVNQWLSDQTTLFFNGGVYGPFTPNTTLRGNKETIGAGFAGMVRSAYGANAVVFACERVRVSLFSQARFQFRRVQNGKPGDLFGTSELRLLETPWSGGTTGDLLGRMGLDADFAGNAFVARRVGQLQLLRPDWITLVYGSHTKPDVEMWDLDSELVGYVYQPGGPGSGKEPIPLSPFEVAHFAPMPDPLAPHRGMSWLTPVVREVLADSAATSHKLQFFEHAATPNMVVKLDANMTKDVFERWVDLFEAKHAGVANAYKTLYLAGGADTTVVGANLQQMDFKVTQGAGETRIAAASGIHPVIVGLSEGLQGSSLNAGNFAAARRSTADITLRPLWQNAAGSLARIINVPPGSELWYDERNISFLQEDRKDAAVIIHEQSVAVRELLMAGFEADAAIEAILADDMGQLRGKHTGLISIQLQVPGSTKMPEGEAPGEKPVGSGTAPEQVPGGNGKVPAKTALPPVG